MTWIVRHTRNRVAPFDYTFHGPFETEDLAESYASHLDWGQEHGKLSVTVKLMPPMGDPGSWPLHVTADEYEAGTGEKLLPEG